MINVTGMFKVMGKEINTYGSEGKKFKEFVLCEYKKTGTIKGIIFGNYNDMDIGDVVILSGDFQIRTWDYKGKKQTGYSIVVSKVEVLGKSKSAPEPPEPEQDEEPDVEPEPEPAPKKKAAPKKLTQASAPAPRPNTKPRPKPVVEDTVEEDDDVPF